MARGGNFGRVPRAAPSLTNLLVSIAREMQSARDKNIMDAWKGGGLFEGKEVTDEMVLDHWKKRMDGVSPDDPLWDTYNTAHMQLDYAINESKMTVKYAQGKIGEAAMAQFYLNWAKKVPQNSEFYRALQRDAAQFMKAAKGRSAADAKRRAEEAYRAQQEGLRTKYGAAGEFLMDTFRIMAQVGSATQTSLIGSPGEGADFSGFDPSDPEGMVGLINALTERSSSSLTEGAVAPTERVIYHNPVTGRSVTGKDIFKRLKEIDPSFDGILDVNAFNGYIAYQLEGLGKQIDLALKTGHTSDVKALTNAQQYVAELGRNVRAWPVQQDYMNAKADFDRVMNLQSASPQVKLAAWEKYQSRLMGLANDPRIATDDYTRNALLAEARGDSSGVALSESFTGNLNIDNQRGSQAIAIDQMNVQMLARQVENVYNNGYQWTQGKYDDAGNFVPQIGGSAIGAAPAATIEALTSEGAMLVPTPQPDGSILPMYVAMAPVELYATDERGNEVKLDNRNSAASFARVVIGGESKDLYSYVIDGQRYYSSENPWGDGFKAKQTDKGLAVDVSALYGQFADGLDLRKNSDQSGAFYVADAKNGKDGKVYLNPQAALWATDPEREAMGGFVPQQDFRTAAVALLHSLPQSEQMQVGKSKEFRKALEFEAYSQAGYVMDERGAWLLPEGADRGKAQSSVQQSMRQYSAVVSAPTVAGQVDALTAMYGRDKPVAQLRPLRRDEGLIGERLGLASDKLRTTPGFGELGAAFAPGTNNLVRGGQSMEAFGVTLTTPSAIKVPGIPDVSVNVNPNTGFTMPDPVQTSPGVAYTPPSSSSNTYTYTPPSSVNSSTQTYGGEQRYGPGNAL